TRPSFVFFFSSRRRHTRFSRDWSSDVCSSDLCLRTLRPGGHLLLVGPHADHLLALREQLYDAIHPTPELIKALPEGLEIVNDQRSEERRVGKECRTRRRGQRQKNRVPRTVV